MISSILKNTYKFVDDDATCEKLLIAYQHFMSHGEPALKEKPVALTNLCGEWRLVRLPAYDNPDPIERTMLNGGEAELVTATAPKQRPHDFSEQGSVPVSAGRFSIEYEEYLKSSEWKERHERIQPKVCSQCSERFVITSPNLSTEG